MRKIIIILVLASMGVMSHVEGSQFPPANLFNNCGLKNCDMQEEIWKDVVGYEGLYQVSNLGRVKSLDREVSFKMPFPPYAKGIRIRKGRILTCTINSVGYPVVTLCSSNQKKYLVHRIKAIAFIPNPDNKPNINHRDGVKENNGYHADGLDNLEWCTQSENVMHSHRVLMQRKGRANLGKFGKNHPSSMAVLQLTKDGVLVNEFDSISQASAMTGINLGNISSCCSKNQKCQSAGGFAWKHKNKKI